MSATGTINSIKKQIDGLTQTAVYRRAGASDPNALTVGQYQITLQITRTQPARADLDHSIQGVPTQVIAKVGDLRGYIQAQAVNPSNLSCEDSEKDALIAMLKEGVYY